MSMPPVRTTISPRLVLAARRAIGPLLLHTYRTSRAVPVLDQLGDPVLDEWRQPVTEPGPTSDPRPCLYESKTRPVIDESGRRLIVVPTLTVYYDDDVRPGDEIVDVTDRDGSILIASAGIDGTDPLAEPGALVIRELVLRDVVVVPELAPLPQETR